MQILIHGEQRHDVQVTVGLATPDFLHVELGEPIEAGSGSTVRIPLSIIVPPGSPDVNYLGVTGKMGEVILETNHPEARQIRMLIQLAVEP